MLFGTVTADLPPDVAIDEVMNLTLELCQSRAVRVCTRSLECLLQSPPTLKPLHVIDRLRIRVLRWVRLIVGH